MEQNKIREKLREIMEEQIGMLKSSKEEPLSISEAPPPSDTDQRAATKSKGGEQEEDKLEGGDNNAAARATHENKAAKIQKLRSGFRICRPQGSFLWPNMGISTPPSATHLIPIPPQPQPQPGSPVKPACS
ncbi:hypothetical protein CerSpe_093080 [Prunus speciosa]